MKYRTISREVEALLLEKRHEFTVEDTPEWAYGWMKWAAKINPSVWAGLMLVNDPENGPVKTMHEAVFRAKYQPAEECVEGLLHAARTHRPRRLSGQTRGRANREPGKLPKVPRGRRYLGDWEADPSWTSSTSAETTPSG